MRKGSFLANLGGKGLRNRDGQIHVGIRQSKIIREPVSAGLGGKGLWGKLS